MTALSAAVVRAAYATRERARVDNLRILLIDDVLMTRARRDACSRAVEKGPSPGRVCGDSGSWFPVGHGQAPGPNRTSIRETVPPDRASFYQGEVSLLH
jgi:hypothetical protein